MEKLYHIVYKTTNKINGKVYYGVHSTNIINDNYIGSGKLLKKAIKKYGKENFIKEILEVFKTRKEASKFENIIVNELIINDNNYYNLKTGGDNGFISPNISKSKLGISRSIEVKKKISDTINGRIKNGTWIVNFKGKNHSLETKKQQSERMKGKYKGEKNPMYGKSRTDEVKKKISDKLKGRKTKPMPDHVKKMMIQIHTGKVVSAESRLRMSESKKGVYNGYKNPNAKQVINIETKEQFRCKNEALIKYNISGYIFKKLINQGKFKYV